MSQRTVRVWLPYALAAAVKEHVGAERFNDYVVNAVEERLRHDNLADLSAELEAEYGPIPAEIRAQTARTWPNFQEG